MPQPLRPRLFRDNHRHRPTLGRRTCITLTTPERRPRNRGRNSSEYRTSRRRRFRVWGCRFFTLKATPSKVCNSGALYAARWILGVRYAHLQALIRSRGFESMPRDSMVRTRKDGYSRSAMSKKGLKSMFPMEEITVMGIWELLPHINKIRVKLKEALEAALLFQPHVVVTIDSKGFSFRLLKQLRAEYAEQGVPGAVHFHYVVPSFWAWKGGEARLSGLAEFIDHLFCILPFEEEVCKSNGLYATFVGHPVLEDVLEFQLGMDLLKDASEVQRISSEFRSIYKIPSGATVVTLLPGSRLQEVTRMLPIFCKTLHLLKDSVPDLTVIIHVAPNQLVEKYITRVVNVWTVQVILIPGGSLFLKYSAYFASTVALCTSGTVAVELQFARLPCVVTYRAHFLTEWFICLKAKIPYISLPNILLDSAIVPEVLFEACVPARLSSLLMGLMHNESLRKEQIVAAEKVIGLLRPSNAIRAGHHDVVSESSTGAPSMIAASTILHFEISSGL